MIEIDSLRTIKKRLKIDDNGAAQKFLVATCYKKMTKYVPKDKNMLRRIVFLDKDSITYMSPYASYQYYGIRKDGTHKVRHYTTPGTGKKWDKKMLRLERKNIIKEVQKFIER